MSSFHSTYARTKKETISTIMAIDQDFTFPFTTTNTMIDSTPWCVGCTSSRDKKGDETYNKEEDVEDELEDREKLTSTGGLHVDEEEDEKMDLLWEDFNENMSDSDMPSKKMVELGCSPALKLAKTGAGRRPSMLVFMKKLFLLHNPPGSLKI